MLDTVSALLVLRSFALLSKHVRHARALHLSPAVLAELSDIVDLPDRAAAVEELMADDAQLVRVLILQSHHCPAWLRCAAAARPLLFIHPGNTVTCPRLQVQAYEGLTVLVGTAANVKEAWRR